MKSGIYRGAATTAKQLYESLSKGLEPKMKEKVQKQFKEQLQHQQESKATVIIMGPSGAGRTIFPRVLSEQEKMTADCGVGKPITSEIQAYDIAEKPITIFDCPGFECGKTMKLLDKFLEENRTEVHCAWIVLNAAQCRVELFWEEEIKKLTEKKIPSIFVLNKSDLVSDSDLDKLEEAIRSFGVERIMRTSSISGQRELKINGKTIQYEAKPQGLEQLIEETMKLIPKARINAFIGGQILSITQKQKLSDETLCELEKCTKEVPFDLFFKYLLDIAQIWGMESDSSTLSDTNFTISDRLSLGADLWTKQMKSVASKGLSTLPGRILSTILAIPVLALSPLLVPISMAFSVGKGSMHIETAMHLLVAMNMLLRNTWLNNLHPSRIALVIAQERCATILTPEVLVELLKMKDLSMHMEIDIHDNNSIQIQDKIETNSQHRVYKGIWKETSVIVKQIPRIDEESLQRELTLLAVLSHPNIVPFIGADTKDHSYVYLITKLMENGNLQDVLDHRKPNIRERLRIAKEITSAIAYLHSLNIIHRDIKTLNILLDANMTAYLCDFGCARDNFRQKTNGVGTLYYIAPEVLQGTTYDMSADIYSLGVVLWQLFSSSTQPFEFKKGDLQLLSEMVQKCSNSDPNQRPSATELYLELEVAERDVINYV